VFQLQLEKPASEDARKISERLRAETDNVVAKAEKTRQRFETIAQKYAQAYPQQYTDALQWYAHYLEGIGEPFGLRTEDQIIEFMNSVYETRPNFAELLNSRLAEHADPLDEEQVVKIADIFSSIAYYRSPRIGFSTWACILFQLPKHLVLGHYWAGIFPLEETRELQDASVEDLRKFPPVFISTMMESDDFCAFALGDNQPFTHETMGQEASERLRDLERLRAREDIEMALITDGYNIELRAAYHVFANEFYNWYSKRNPAEKQKGKSKRAYAIIPRANNLFIPSDLVSFGTNLGILKDTKKDNRNGNQLNFFQADGTSYKVFINPRKEADNDDVMTNIVEDIALFAAKSNPEASKTLVLSMVMWFNAWSNDTLEDEAIVCHANQFLEKFGVEKNNGAFRLPQKNRIAEHMRYLNTLMLKGEAKGPNGKVAKLTGRMFDIIELENDDGCGGKNYSFSFAPARAYKAYITSFGRPEKGKPKPQTALLPASFFELDVSTVLGRETWALAVYIARQFQIRGKNGNWNQPLTVRTILESSGIGIEKNPNKYWDTMERFDEIWDALVIRGLAASWQYDPTDYDHIYSKQRDKHERWLNSRIIFMPSEEIEKSAKIRAEAWKEHVECAEAWKKRIETHKLKRFETRQRKAA
jgi:hypothetical protein